MDLGIAGRTAVVTGATSGLGLAAATALAAEGCRLAICARDATRLRDTARQLKVHNGHEVLAEPLDIQDAGGVSLWLQRVCDELGGPHIVVVNGGSPRPGAVDEVDLDDYRAALEAVLLPHVGLTLAALPYLRRAGWGRVLLVGSETARQPIPQYGLSSTVRPALLGFARSLVHSLAGTGVTVNVVAPGYHDTAGLRRSFGESAGERIAEIGRHIPVGRVGRPKEFGAVVAFLASEHAAFITGTCLLVDGGATRGIG